MGFFVSKRMPVLIKMQKYRAVQSIFGMQINNISQVRPGNFYRFPCCVLIFVSPPFFFTKSFYSQRQIEFQGSIFESEEKNTLVVLLGKK